MGFAFAEGDVQTRDEVAAVGMVHDLIGDEFDVTTGERNGYPLPTRCDQCRSPYQRKRKDQRFCSPACSASWHRANQKKTPRAGKVRKVTALPVPVVTPLPAGAAGVDLAGFLGQVLNSADEWHLEARLGGLALTLRKDR